MTNWLFRIQKAIDSRLNQSYIHFVLSIVLVWTVVMIAVATIWVDADGRTVFGPYLGADFVSFYAVGTIHNEISPDKIYNQTLQQKVYQQIFPTVPDGVSLPYANAPFLIVIWAILARLPYLLAYLLWMCISILLYIASFAILKSSLTYIPIIYWGTIFLLSFTFPPLIVESVIGGQITVLGFFFIANAIRANYQEHSLVTGMWLSFCLYKPTLLVLLLPMLLVTKQYKVLAGFLIGSMSLLIISLMLIGYQGVLHYLQGLLFFTDEATSTNTALRTWKYIDLNSFVRMLIGSLTWLRWFVWGTIVASFGYLMWCVWRRARINLSEDWQLIVSITLTATLVFNIYVAIYDASLLVISLLLFTNALYAYFGHLPKQYQYLLVALYVASWITQSIAQISNLQVFTVLLIVAVLYLLNQARKIQDKDQITIHEIKM